MLFYQQFSDIIITSSKTLRTQVSKLLGITILQSALSKDHTGTVGD